MVYIWNFGDDFARNVIIFGIDNTSSSLTDNLKDISLVLGKGPTYGIYKGFGSLGKKV